MEAAVVAPAVAVVVGPPGRRTQFGWTISLPVASSRSITSGGDSSMSTSSQSTQSSSSSAAREGGSGSGRARSAARAGPPASWRRRPAAAGSRSRASRARRRCSAAEAPGAAARASAKVAVHAVALEEGEREAVGRVAQLAEKHEVRLEVVGSVLDRCRDQDERRPSATPAAGARTRSGAALGPELGCGARGRPQCPARQQRLGRLLDGPAEKVGVELLAVPLAPPGMSRGRPSRRVPDRQVHVRRDGPGAGPRPSVALVAAEPHVLVARQTPERCFGPVLPRKHERRAGDVAVVRAADDPAPMSKKRNGVRNAIVGRQVSTDRISIPVTIVST